MISGSDPTISGSAMAEQPERADAAGAQVRNRSLASVHRSLMPTRARWHPEPAITNCRLLEHGRPLRKCLLRPQARLPVWSKLQQPRHALHTPRLSLFTHLRARMMRQLHSRPVRAAFEAQLTAASCSFGCELPDSAQERLQTEHPCQHSCPWWFLQSNLRRLATRQLAPRRMLLLLASGHKAVRCCRCQLQGR
jgi:hypothetical protein